MLYVSIAKRAGKLPLLDGSIKCVDCGGIARHYEHRDYTRPLEVEPVCPSCNYKRGPARNSGFEEKCQERFAEWQAVADAIRETEKRNRAARLARRIEKIKSKYTGFGPRIHDCEQAVF